MDTCVNHNPGYSSIDFQVRCGFHGQFYANGAYWYEQGYYIYGRSYLSGFYVIGGWRKVWYWDGGWSPSGCQGYDAASRTWFALSC